VDSFAKLAEFIQEARVGMFTTATADGTLHSRPLATRQVDAAGNALWFFAASNFNKAEAILDNKEVAISYLSPDQKGYVSVSGRAHVIHDHAKAEELWTPMTSTRFPKTADDPRLVLLRVDVESVEYWDAP
ncbi:MAG: pyridoxamine 5-phosphate oxidase, partial [Lacunisphaera sp.]|nr:pyridoxamine 5-phosphate oxidase [Lacunisphaera sp.]